MAKLRALSAVVLASAVACSNVSPDPNLGDDGDDQADDSGPDAAVPPPPPPPPLVVTMYVHSGDTLYTIDDLNFDLTEIGTFDNGDNITDIAVTPDGRLFGISLDSLYQIDINTGAATFVAPVPGQGNVGLTFLPNGQLLATDKTGGVREVSPDTGAVSEIGKFGNSWGTAGDLVAVADGTMFAIGEEQDGPSEASDFLLTVDTQQGDATWVGELGHNSVWGAAYAQGKVYAFTDGGEVIEVDPATGAGTLVRTHPVEFWGAAVTPLVSVE